LAGHFAVIALLPAEREHQPMAFGMQQRLALAEDMRAFQPGESGLIVVGMPGQVGLVEGFANRLL
jgi:hypothetical protein